MSRTGPKKPQLSCGVVLCRSIQLNLHLQRWRRKHVIVPQEVKEEAVRLALERKRREEMDDDSDEEQ